MVSSNLLGILENTASARREVMTHKILHITKIKGILGSENHLLTLLSELDAQRFEVHFCILAEHRHFSTLSDYAKKLEQAGVRVLILPISRHGGPQLLWTLRKYMIRERFDLVHTHLIHADFYGTLAAKLSGVPAIVSSRHNDDQFRHRKMLIGLNRFLAQFHSKIIVISEWISTFLQEVEGIPADKIVPIRYGLQPEPIMRRADPSYVRRQFQIQEQVPVIGTIGRLTAQKGQRYLLQALKRVTAQFPDIRVLILGDGELRVELENQARELGIAGNLILPGYRTDAIELLSGFDFFVFPSLWEGFGLVLLEAMALKKAIVASRVSAIPETVLNGQTGLLVPPKDPEKLSDALLTLLREPVLAQKMGESGFERLQAHFGIQNMVKATERIYNEALLTKER
jgi:glycosyltransferase involved in cell wall biosynthesis